MSEKAQAAVKPPRSEAPIGVAQPPRKRATIRDVARMAGVSIATVSLALSNHPGVAEVTRQKVKDAALFLGYNPSAVGRALQSQRTNVVGLVIPHSSQHVFSHLYFMDVMAGVSEVLNAEGKTLMVSTSPSEDEEEAAYLKILRSQQVDGVILASAALNDDNIARLKATGYPVVFIGRYPLDPGIPTVSIDDIGGAYQAVRHLLEHGHTRIAHISGPLAHLSALDRYEGYAQALLDMGIVPRAQYCYEGDYSEEAGRAGMQALLALDEPPTALFAANDETAVGAMSVLRAAGIEPGVQFPIVSFDDVVIARLVSPQLTTVRQPMRRLGMEAARLLLELMKGRAPRQLHIRLPVELVVRNSCGCV
jgi:DNA-binding LacI/PurR family transcriptional regulator